MNWLCVPHLVEERMKQTTVVLFHLFLYCIRSARPVMFQVQRVLVGLSGRGYKQPAVNLA